MGSIHTRIARHESGKWVCLCLQGSLFGVDSLLGPHFDTHPNTFTVKPAYGVRAQIHGQFWCYACQELWKAMTASNRLGHKREI